eukprot:CAMPEP_0119044806 /NCGR_PEP_ID=MMETSP1177-20130426/34709_1 /TAXON_ID=2985 /ORGANISM="Ochromonas sp, Strain CCMP1899" /LENGTH=419 /DNA_ID=CAMNT_0007015505 /DNA_START=1364 /DNA_END=2620 /DNA_ORIENTATION=-
MASDTLKARIEKIIRSEQISRTSVKLSSAVLFTQSNWRKKKAYVAATNLEKLQEDQEIFTTSKGPAGNMDLMTGGGSFVVKEVLPIVHIGTTLLYERTLTEEDGKIPFQVRKLPATETALITKSSYPDNYIDGSKILSINGNRTIAMDYETVKKSLASSDYPLILGLEMPLRPEQKPSIHSLLIFNDDDVKYNILKILLTNGMIMIKHNIGMMNQTNHLSMIKISDKEFFYTSKWDPLVHGGDLFNKISLFRIKFIKGGIESENVKSLRKIDPYFCFELCLDDGKNIVFEIPLDAKLEKEQVKEAKKKATSGGKGKDDVGTNPRELLVADSVEKILIDKTRREKEAAILTLEERYAGQIRDGESVKEEFYHKLLCASFVSSFKKLILEIRGSQVYFDGEGNVTRRITAKTALRKVDKTV